MNIQQLLEDLAIAVGRRERMNAFELARQIEQQLAHQSAERDSEMQLGAHIEARVRALLAELDTVAALPTLKFRSFDLRTDRGIAPVGSDRLSPLLVGAPAGDDRLYSVWFGTNRRLSINGQGFTGERSADTTLGTVTVRIPAAHRFGEIGTSFWTKLRRFDFRDDRLRVHGVQVQDKVQFFDSLQRAMAPEDSREALCFLHGYNVNFEDAAIRAAQLGCDLAIPGATAFFSWPSRGSVSAYAADGASIEASERAITEFLVDFVDRSGASRVHLIAHSMGNRGLLRALQRIAGRAESIRRVEFGQIFLAAPDVDRDLFLDLANLYPLYSERTTLYASNADLPVHLSARLHDAPRAGYFRPYTVAPDVDTIAVPDFDIDLLGHSYFAQAEALLHDMFDLIRNNRSPNERQRLGPMRRHSSGYWELGR